MKTLPFEDESYYGTASFSLSPEIDYSMQFAELFYYTSLTARVHVETLANVAVHSCRQVEICLRETIATRDIIYQMSHRL